jgi:predicted dehydrogenase
MSTMSVWTRRDFIRGVAGAAALGPFVITRGARAQGQTVRHASIGSAGMALSDMKSFAKHPAFELVAVADVDLCLAAGIQELFPRARIYQDWRELLDKEEGRIDSINVSTPDHMHAAIALEAIGRNKHVYIQKPLTTTVEEARVVAERACRQGVVSQMGIQISSAVPQRLGEALARSGIVGKIREVHAFCDKSWGEEKPLPATGDPVPPALDWDLWLGVAEARPFLREAYHPGQWRKRVGLGTGTLGDMGCHIFSPPYRALALTSPATVTSHGPRPTRESWATRARIHYVFPGTRYTAGETLDFWWYDGGETAPETLLAAIGPDRIPKSGVVFVGTEGFVILPHVDDPFVLPEAKALDAAPLIERTQAELAPRDHYGEFLDAVLAGGRTQPSTNVSYATPLTETVLLGDVAAWFPGETLQYDPRAMRFATKPEADAHLRRSYRSGWKPEVLS